MKLSKIFNSKLNKVFGLPTYRGLVLFLILGLSIWYLFTYQSQVERGIFFLMLVIILLHLMEIGQFFRQLEYKILDFDPPISGEPFLIPFQISHAKKSKIENLFLRLDSKSEWLKMDLENSLTAKTFFVPYTFINSGLQKIPQLTLKYLPEPYFFQFWKKIKFLDEVYVLPQAINHHVSCLKKNSQMDEGELSDLELLRDPFLWPQADQKLLLKTGDHYQRRFQSNHFKEAIELSWSNLKELSPYEQAEQFSYWINYFSQLKNQDNYLFTIDTPFFEQTQLSSVVDWKKVKITFAKWLYDKSK